MQNVLITGGAGFIGSNLALALLKKGYQVTVLDNLSPQIHGDATNSQLYLSIKDKVKFIEGDVCKEADWRRALDKQDIVVHLAAETGTGQSMYQVKKYTDVNINGTAILLDLLTNSTHQVKKLIIASSRAIYGEGKYQSPTHGIVYPTHRQESDMLNGDFEVKCPFSGENAQVLATDEESKIHPSSIYGITKQNQEQMCMVTGKSLGLPVVAFRYQNVYGPGQSLKNPYTGILSIFSTRILNHNDIQIFEDGTESRDFVFIDDVVDATISGIEKDEANYQAFNVGTGVSTSVSTVAQTLKSLYEADIKIKITGGFRLGDIRHNYADLSKIQQHLGFKPRFDFKQGITQFVNWVKTQNVEADNFDKSIQEMKAKGLYK